LKTQAQIAIAATDPAIKERALRQIVVAIDRTTRLVKQLLAIAKVDSGSGAEHNQTVNVGEVLDDIEQLQPKAGSIRIERENAIFDLYVQSNREILTVALRNLHENAIQYTPSGGRVSWRLIPNGTGIFVEDDGPGIPNDELPLVGRRFYRRRHKNIT
jgi:two-component system sensor histidine kinase QseC